MSVLLPEPGPPVMTTKRPWFTSSPGKIDEPPLRIDVDELDGNTIADVEPGSTPDDFALGDGLHDSHPRAFVGRARHDALEALSDAIEQQQRSRGLADLALDLRRVLLLH